MKALITTCRLKLQRKRFRVGATFSHFIAKDIRRKVEVVDASEISQGFVTAKIRTWNVLYAIKGIVPQPNFGHPRRIRIDDLWDWDGPVWGGPVPPKDPVSKK